MFLPNCRLLSCPISRAQLNRDVVSKNLEPTGGNMADQKPQGDYAQLLTMGRHHLMVDLPHRLIEVSLPRGL